MTEKRYDCKWTSYDISGQIWDNKNPYDYMNVQEVCDRLNELNDENEDLKIEIQKLKKENQRIEDLEHQLNSISGLWASDKEDMSYPFRLEFKEL